MDDAAHRALVDEMWAEVEAETAYLDRLMKGDVTEEEETVRRAKTIEQIETGTARQRLMMEQIRVKMAMLEGWLKTRH